MNNNILYLKINIKTYNLHTLMLDLYDFLYSTKPFLCTYELSKYFPFFTVKFNVVLLAHICAFFCFNSAKINLLCQFRYKM